MAFFFFGAAIFALHSEQLPQLEIKTLLFFQCVTACVFQELVQRNAREMEAFLKFQIFAPDCNRSDISDPGSDFQAERQQAREETKREALKFFSEL